MWSTASDADCHRNCPRGADSRVYSKAYARGDIKNLKVFDVTKCIRRGRCSYICPAKIPLQQICLEAGRMVREVEKDVCEYNNNLMEMQGPHILSDRGP